MCCLQEVRWRKKCSRMLGMKRRFQFRRSRNGDAVAGVGIIVKEKLCERMVEV